MIYLVSMLGVMALLAGALAVIAITLRDHADAVVAALAGRSISAAALVPPVTRVRVTVRTTARRPSSFQSLPLRAAA
jgi:non-ribosomal peptide synthetase component E (peptide arylation enzyme)